MIASYENGRHEPPYDMLIQIARYFNVIVDYLIGNENLPQRTICLSMQENELLQNYRKIGDSEKDLLGAMAKALNK